VAAFCAVAGDLAGGVDGVGIDQHPAGVGGDEIVQVLHAAGRGPQHGMGGVVRDVSVTYNLAAVVDAEGDAVSAAGKRAEVIDSIARIPLHGVPIEDRSRVRLSGDDARGIDGIGDARVAAGKRSQIFSCRQPRSTQIREK